jgi:hypothetical protein
MSALSITIDTADVGKMFLKLPGKNREAAQVALNRCALLAQREAIKNAPRSPTQSQLNKAMTMWAPKGSNTLVRTNKEGVLVQRPRGRKAGSSSRPMPGGLEKSITSYVNGLEAIVFISANSHAGKYARKMHDERGKTWSNLGIGSKAKGARVSDKFIEHAIFDNEANFKKIFDSELKKAIQQ